MEQAETIRVIEGLMDYLDTGTNVDAGKQLLNPVSAYTSPTLAEQEWQTFFQNYPQVLGLSADLPGPGSFITNQDLGVPILCTRDAQGVYHAFLNVCRHRGTIVEDELRGEKPQFNCPFHAWGYDHKGALVAVPKEAHFGAVDRECHSLIELPAEEYAGILWVHPKPDERLELQTQLGALGPELERWRLSEYRYQANTTFEHAMNWKLANDTFGETYHFNTLHKNTLALDFYGNAQIYDTYERNHRMMLCLRNIDSLRAQPKAEWNLLHGALPVYYLFPNVQLIIGGDGPTLVRVYPDATNPNHSRSQISFYLDEQEHERLQSIRGVDVSDAESRARGFADVIRDEDYVAAASAHIGALSNAQEFVTFGRNEPALHHYHNTYREALGMPPLQVVESTH